MKTSAIELIRICNKNRWRLPYLDGPGGIPANPREPYSTQMRASTSLSTESMGLAHGALLTAPEVTAAYDRVMEGKTRAHPFSYVINQPRHLVQEFPKGQKA